MVEMSDVSTGREVLVPHARARLTVHGRLLIVQRARAGWPQAHIAAAMGVSRRCVKRWLDRYRDAGEGGFGDRSSRPHRIANRTPDARAAEVVALRQNERLGRDDLAADALEVVPRGHEELTGMLDVQAVPGHATGEGATAPAIGAAWLVLAAGVRELDDPKGHLPGHRGPSASRSCGV